MQLTPEQQGEFAAEANAMTWRLCELVRQHKALLLGICKTPLTASSTRPDTVTVRSLSPSAWPSIKYVISSSSLCCCKQYKVSIL